MKHHPSWKANGSSASLEIPQILWNPKVHYRVHNSLPLAPFLSQINPVHALTSHLFKANFNIIIPSTPKSFKLRLYFRFLSLPRNCHRPNRFTLVHPNNIWWGTQIFKLLIMEFPPVSCYFLFLFLFLCTEHIHEKFTRQNFELNH
jgi:hypothetical protein